MEERASTHSIPLGYLLWIFGFTGSHRFYYGKTWTGILYYCTFGLLGVGWIIDFFLIPGMERESNRKFAPGRYDYSVAWLLLTFLGIFGVHRFYLGKWVSGIIWLCTGGLLGVGWVYDFINMNEIVNEQNLLK
ncbi:TM2 domain-containing protein [Peredibacter starrii]|uniref:TM2 domain-containing protein n=1 Tax=Peredibacter starrii TaxID=28202 RepID=A0AAX4HND0_9BACT|nr:TM2 domain-containing protein [Peredibacter starrii]WPU64813.1 TM2 domain-containing protein [Peredibacter starrii]